MEDFVYTRDMTLSEFANHFIALLVIANPLSALTAVIRITRHQTAAQKKQTATVASSAIAIIMLIAIWVGMPLLAVLGIKLAAFQVAGSIVLLFLAFAMLNAEESPIKQTAEEKEKHYGESGAIVPLAIPIIAGPGTITTLIVSVNQNPSLVSQTLISLAALLVTGLMFVVLYFSNILEDLIGPRGLNIFNRIGGLLLAAIAIQALANGIMGLFPFLSEINS